MSFLIESTPRRIGDDRFAATFTEDWSQGPGVYGGMVAAVLLRAACEASGTDRPPRTQTVHYAAPVVPGEGVIETRVERVGSRVSHLSVRLLQEGKTQAFGTVTLGRERPKDLDFEHVSAPAAPPPGEVAPMPFVQGVMPTFLGRWDSRWIRGDLPFSGGSGTEVASWLRLRQPAPLDAAFQVAALDMPPPIILGHTATVRPMATVALTAFFLDAELDCLPDAHVIVTAHSRSVRDGYADQESRLFTPDGRLTAVARQLIAVIR